MTEPKLDRKAPAFKLSGTGESTIVLSKLKGSHVVLFFYPRDNTPGCTKEAVAFGEAYNKFKRANTIVFGISNDGIASHEKFKSKYDLPFELLSDESTEVSRKYAVMKMKNMYGKQFEGIERSTFLIDASGVLKQSWRKVKVPGHVDEVLSAVKNLPVQTAS